MAAPGATIAGGGGTPLGYQQISAGTLATATALTIPTGATLALVRTDTAGVRWRDDGTAPTGAVGMQLLPADEPYAFTGASMTAVKFILTTGGSPVLNVCYY
jgi:hypothetical protein